MPEQSVAPTIGLEEAAQYLHIAPSTLRKRAAAGNVAAYKPGRRWVFKRAEIEQYLEVHRARCPSISISGLRTASSPAERAGSGLAHEIAAKRRSLKQQQLTARPGRRR